MFVTLAIYVHDLDPIAVRFGPDDSAFPGIRWYGLSYLVAFAIAYPIIRRVLKRGVSTIRLENALDLVLVGAFGAILGARLGYCLFYEPSLLVHFSGEFPFWGLLMMNRGGMSSHGGMLGILIGTWLYARHWGHRWGHTLDVLAFAAPPGLFFGRLANFINGELYGRPCSPDFPFAVRFPTEMFGWLREDPEAARQTLAPVLERFTPEHATLHQRVSMLIAEVRAGNEDVIAALGPLLTPRYPSQIFAALTEGLVVMIVLLIGWRRPRKPMTLVGLFAVSYACMRIFNELFREPDIGVAKFEALGVTLTRGQLLSVGILLAGAAMIWLAQRQDAPAMGGWRGRGGDTTSGSADAATSTSSSATPPTPASGESGGRSSSSPPRKRGKRRRR